MSQPRRSGEPETYATRRERRLAARAASRGSGGRGRPNLKRRRFGGPLAWITGLIVLAAAVFFGFQALTAGPAAAKLTPPVFETPVALADGRALGAPSAKVTVDVWADFQCPACDLFTTTIEPQIVDNYVTKGDVRLVFHDFAFIGPESKDAAVAARAADQQGFFWPYHDWLYANQGRENSGAFSRANLEAIAGELGLDMTKFRAALDDSSLADAVAAEIKDGQAQGVNSTPTLFVDGTKAASYDYATLSAAIDQALGAGSNTPGSSGAPNQPVGAPTPAVPNPNPPTPNIPVPSIGLP